MLKENTYVEPMEMMKTIWDLRPEVNKEIESLKQTQAEINIVLKDPILKLKRKTYK